jgi:hypothetical protein
MQQITIVAVLVHARGKVYKVMVDGKTVLILLTFHVLERIAKWQLTVQAVLHALLFPEEVLRGHRGRFIAHRRKQRHVVRAVYEYEGSMPVVVTVYSPSAKRYFQGGGIYENHILS